MAEACYKEPYLPGSFKFIPFKAIEASSEHGRRGAEGESREPGDGVGEGADGSGPEMRLRNQRNAGRGDKHAEREKRPALPVIN